MQRYNEAWNDYMADQERVVSAHKELYNQYKNIYADNNNYILPETKIVNMVVWLSQLTLMISILTV